MWSGHNGQASDEMAAGLILPAEAVMAGNNGKNKRKDKTEGRHLRKLEKVRGRVRAVNPIHAPDTALTL